MVAPVALGLLALSLVPITLAGLELVTTRAAPSEVIDRDVGSATMLQVVGNAFDTGLPAGTDAQGRPRRWLALRDGPDRRSMLLVRTPEPAEALRTRDVTARVATDANLVARVTDALAARGAQAPGAPVAAAALDGRYLVESPGAADPRRLEDPADIASLPAGTIVEVELRLTGEGIAACTLDAACDARRIGAGEATWLQRAAGGESTQEVLFQTAYPPTVTPVDLVGEQVREPPAVIALLDSPAAGVLIGWGRTLEVALLEHDPALPIDRSLAAIGALVGLGIFLLLARRLPYPVFRHEAPVPRWAGGTDGTAISGVATGRLAVGDGPPVEAASMAVTFVPGSPPRVVAQAPAGQVTLDVPAASAAVSGLERGRLAWLRRSRPAIWLNWYRTDLRVAFETAGDRDAAAALLSSVSAPPAAPPATPLPPPPPRRAPRTEPDEPAPTWRRPRPRGVR